MIKLFCRHVVCMVSVIVLHACCMVCLSETVGAFTDREVAVVCQDTGEFFCDPR